jgi:hypothetical protein
MNFLKLMLCVWLWEACGVFVILGLYRMEGESDVLAFLSHRGGKLFLGAAILFLFTCLLVSWFYSALARNGSPPLHFIVKWNFVPLILVITIAEAALRMLSIDTPSGTLLGKQKLGPLSLQVVTPHNSQKSNENVYYDQLLGWTVRPNLSSSNGLYFTGPEGIRTSRPDITLASKPVACRVALVGDSHTFGAELKFEETWAYGLKDYLKRCQILNFGVGGYSVGQMYLRYLRDVRPWHPDLVILALSSHSATHTMGVYGLNMFSDFLPWAQPRFELRNHQLVVINVPLPSLEAIATARSMCDLPYIDYDWFFVPGRWELPRWRYLYNSYLFRLYTTWFPLSRTQQDQKTSDAINYELLRSFLQTAKTDGTRALILYLPDKDDYGGADQEMPSLRILRTSGFEYFDLRPCLNNVDAKDRFISNGGHYSARGSTAIARCIATRLPFSKHQVNTS